MRRSMISKFKQEDVQAKKMEMSKRKRGISSIEGPCLRGNPRIYRVSPLFGGKDRHSKVCTMKGLRDRRIRLSAPTAIQLYDLQSRLGLTQPSKVMDWLIDITRFEIDKLPPLLFPKHFDPNPQILHQSASMILPQVISHFDVAMKPKNESLLSAPHQTNNVVDENCCHFEPSSFPFPLMEANNPASFSSASSSQFLFCPLMMPSASEVSPYVPTDGNQE